MKVLKIFMTSCALICSFINPADAQRVIIIGLDGFSSEAFNAAKHPNIDTLFAEGVMSLTTRPVMPSATLPNWTSHLTGSGPEEHGVTSNSWTLAKHDLEPIAADKSGFYPSIFKLLKEQKPTVKTAFYYNWAELINSMNTDYIDEVSFEANDDFHSNYNKAVNFIIKNQNEPELIFLYSVRIDHAGHKYKWMSPQYIAAIEEADTAIAGLITTLKKQKLYKDTYFLLLTDHGGVGYGHGGVSMAEMQVPWGITGPSIKKSSSRNPFGNSNKNTAWVISKIFKINDVPLFWSGEIPKGLFK